MVPILSTVWLLLLTARMLKFAETAAFLSTNCGIYIFPGTAHLSDLIYIEVRPSQEVG